VEEIDGPQSHIGLGDKKSSQCPFLESKLGGKYSTNFISIYHLIILHQFQNYATSNEKFVASLCSLVTVLKTDTLNSGAKVTCKSTVNFNQIFSAYK
jgi:hypothetical protein